MTDRVTHQPEEKIRIIFGLNDFLVGGVQKQFSEQMRHFDRARFEITLITLFQFPAKENLYAALPADLSVHRFAFRGWWDTGEWLKLYRLLREVRPHIVVSSLFFSNTVFRVLKLPLRFVSIAREHNTYAHKTLLQRTLDRLLARVSYKIVAVSATVAKFTSAQEHIPQSRFATIHNGVDVLKIRLELEKLPSKDLIKKGFNLLPVDRVLLNVARLTKQKNHRLLISEFAHLYKKHPEYKLAIVGDGKLQQELEQYAAESGAKDAILFFGHQSDTFRFYKMADVFVSTSNIEGLSNSYLKALAAGLPLVVTKTAGTDELIKDGWNGFFVTGESVDALTGAIEKLSRLEEKVIQKRARETAERFSIQKTVAQYQSLFEAAHAMRILIATGLYPPQIGGHAKYAKEIHDRLIERGHEAPVAAFGEVKYLPAFIRHLVYFSRLLVRTRGCDVILAFDTWSVGVPALLVAHLRGLPLVVRVGGDFLWESYIERGGELVPLPEFYTSPQALSFKERIIARGTRWFTKHAAKLLFNSAWQRDIWLKAYDIPLERTVLVENEYTGFVAAEPPANKSFVAAGRAIRLKNIPLLKEAVEAVKKTHPDVVLDIQPLPPEEHEMRLRGCYAVIEASISTMNPNVIWEGLAFGKPFICTKYTGATERLKDLGIFFDPADGRELKAAIEELLKPQMYALYVERIREFAYTYTWEQITDEILAAIPKKT